MLLRAIAAFFRRPQPPRHCCRFILRQSFVTRRFSATSLYFAILFSASMRASLAFFSSAASFRSAYSRHADGFQFAIAASLLLPPHTLFSPRHVISAPHIMMLSLLLLRHIAGAMIRCRHCYTTIRCHDIASMIMPLMTLLLIITPER